MKITKKRRLEAAGWKETSVKEFLNLSEADMQFIEVKLALSRRLRELRQKRHLTQTKAATPAQNQPKPLRADGSGRPYRFARPLGARAFHPRGDARGTGRSRLIKRKRQVKHRSK